MPKRSFLTALLLGMLIGAVVLGLGGRVNMRIFAILQEQNPGFSLGGSVTIIFLGAVAGMSGGVALWLGRRLFPKAPLARGLLFWGVLLFLTARVLRPIDSQRLLVFGPLALIYGVVLYRLWCRRYVKRWQIAQPTT